MNIYVVRHEFHNGEATFVVRCNYELTERTVCKKLALNFEPEKGEYLHIEKMDDIIDLEEDFPYVDVAVSGFEFICPVCQQENKISIIDGGFVKCANCNNEFQVGNIGGME